MPYRGGHGKKKGDGECIPPRLCVCHWALLIVTGKAILKGNFSCSSFQLLQTEAYGNSVNFQS
jgi:hypothetical protein